ncbi:MAG: AbrB/MazE/SpoVT family DNA-binding domain-containing protein [Limisphaerales bacterium]
MKLTELTVTQIGNSRGIRLPAAMLRKYGITNTILVEERPDEIVLKTKRDKKLSWKETFADMAQKKEDWSDLDTTVSDGLDEH